MIALIPLLGNCADEYHYLGQRPPGNKPELFGSGVISQAGFELHSSLAVSLDGKEMYFVKLVRGESSSQNVILWTRYENGQWVGPDVAPFSGEYNDVTPSFSPDGTRLYFSSNRPRNGSDETRTDRDIWFVERDASRWGPPTLLGGPVNSTFSEGSVSLADNGSMYFYRSVGRDRGSGEIYRSVLVDGLYSDPKRLSGGVNTDDYENFPSIAPDESYLVFYARGGADGAGQYVTFRRDDGSWSAPVSMGDAINAGATAFSLSFSPDRKYVFVLRRSDASSTAGEDEFIEGIYWVGAGALGTLQRAGPHSSLGQQPASEKELRLAVSDFGRAFASADVSALQLLLTEDYTHVNGSSGNVITRDQWLGWVASRRAELDAGTLVIETYTVEDLRVQLYGETAVVSGIVRSRGLNGGTPFDSNIRFTNVWVLEEGVWRRAAFHDSRLPDSGS